MTLSWVYTPGVGHAAILPDNRLAYVEESRTKPGFHRLRIVKKPGQVIADYYSGLYPTPGDCQRLAEGIAQRETKRRADRAA